MHVSSLCGLLKKSLASFSRLSHGVLWLVIEMILLKVNLCLWKISKIFPIFDKFLLSLGAWWRTVVTVGKRMDCLRSALCSFGVWTKKVFRLSLPRWLKPVKSTEYSIEAQQFFTYYPIEMIGTYKSNY